MFIFVNASPAFPQKPDVIHLYCGQRLWILENGIPDTFAERRDFDVEMSENEVVALAPVAKAIV